MPTIVIERTIDAPPARCYDLARHVEAHEATMGAHDERAVAPPGGAGERGDREDATGAREDGTGEDRTGAREEPTDPSGLLDAGDTVTWQARHFGLPLSMTARVTATDRPRYFRDEMVAGPFATFVHDHHFRRIERPSSGSSGDVDAPGDVDASTPRGHDGEWTRMRDTVTFASPLGPLGRVVDLLVLEAYLRDLLADRAATLATLAEGEGWRRFLE